MKFSKTSRRTIFLALLAAGSFVYSAIYHFDIDPALMLDLFKMSVVLMLIAMTFGAIVAGIITWFRKRGD